MAVYIFFAVSSLPLFQHPLSSPFFIIFSSSPFNCRQRFIAHVSCSGFLLQFLISISPSDVFRRLFFVTVLCQHFSRFFLFWILLSIFLSPYHRCNFFVVIPSTLLFASIVLCPCLSRTILYHFFVAVFHFWFSVAMFS